ncbi:MAG: SIR2 family protein [Paracoccaceae bacterium]|nr:SIR2 family protein [Paracoccaceae bacterium]MDE2917661.1 SIR2 family protein [Paracoccaceae bacterium]
MRFYEDGPALPDTLLDGRDEGRVVFLCGAGVSIPSGLPSFIELTKHVIEYFHPPDHSDIKKAFKPWLDQSTGFKKSLDEIYSLLHEEYGRDEVNSLITKKILESENENNIGIEHDLIKRISSDKDGAPQIVTTNIDRLFEKNLKGDIPIYEPPKLPDLAFGSSIGITYLHGRIPEFDSRKHPYVFSSADFGQAYLSQAWATNFVRNLLNKYTVVLLGYKAEDPPVEYLLRGLGNDGRHDSSRLFAFDKGLPEEIEPKWQGRGVTPIPYSCHKLLWNTIEAWADRANNPGEWKKAVISKAVQDPKILNPYERGQVVHVLQSASGARIFSEFEPRPHPEWICVLDANIRCLDQGRGIGQGSGSFDPRISYGLDDGPNEQSEDDFLVWCPGDEKPTDCHSLGNQQIEIYKSIPRRLFYILTWIVKSFESPVMVWWVGRQFGLHPRLIYQFELKLSRDKSLHENARRVWNLILEVQRGRQRILSLVDHRWDNLESRISIEGWTKGALREFRAIYQPHIELHGNPQPPSKEWEDIGLGDIGQFRVSLMKFDRNDLKFPDDVLLDVMDILVDSVYLASGLLTDIGAKKLETPTCYPDREMQGQEFLHPPAACEVFSLLKDLFDRITILHPEQAQTRAVTWWVEDRFFFRKLKLYALSKTNLFNAEQVADTLLSLRQDIFWDTDVVRELLFLIIDRWLEFSSNSRELLTERILEGPDPLPHWLNEKRVKEYAARYARYLELNGCTLPNDCGDKLTGIISQIPNWNDGWARSMVIGGRSSGGWVKVDPSPEGILDLSVAEIIPKTREIMNHRDGGSFTDKRPFEGLVQANPQKALDSLIFEGTKDEYPEEFWSKLIKYLPEDVSLQLRRDFLQSLKKLPKHVIIEFRFDLSKFLEDKLKSSIEFDDVLGWAVYDHIVEGILSGGKDVVKSGIIDDVDSRGNEQSRRTLDHALNGPMGMCTKALVSTIPDHREKEATLPDCIKSRMEQLLKIQGEGSDHVISIYMWKLDLLMGIDPDWVKEILIPMLDWQNPASEPAWNGLLHVGNPSPELTQAITPHMLNLFPTIEGFTWGRYHATRAAEWLLYMNIFKSNQPDGVTNNEMRTVLRSMSDSKRNQVINWLEGVGKDNENGWICLVTPFIKDVWPREIKYRTYSSILGWIDLLGKSCDSFPVVFEAVRGLLNPVKMDTCSLEAFTEGINPIVMRFPEQMLELLDTITLTNSPQPSYFSEVREILDTIADTNPELKSHPKYRKLIDLIE